MANAAEQVSPYLTVEEVAAFLRVSPRTVHDLIRRGKLDAIRAGSRKLTRVTRISVEAFVAGEE